MITPLFARVLLKRDVLKAGSIIIPEQAQERNAPAKGTVIAVGPTADESIKEGQRVVFGRHAGAWLKEGDDDFYIVQDEDILGVIND